MNLSGFFNGLSKAQMMIAAIGMTADVVRQVEAGVVASGIKIPGTDKFNMALEGLNVALEAEGYAADAIKSAAPAFTTLINGWVKRLQAAGWFPKATGLTNAPSN